MLLNALLQAAGLPPQKEEREITLVCDALERVRPGALFVCIPGAHINGELLAGAAVQMGAAAIAAANPVDTEAVFVRVAQPRAAFSALAAAFAGRPDRKLKLIGVTGTNGKTTVAYYIKHIIEACGGRCAYIGTLGAQFGNGALTPGVRTTPESDRFFSLLSAAVDAGCGYCAAEVSSQALDQSRVEGASFCLGVVTNISRDHLDYHGSQEALVRAKARLCERSARMLLNADDAFVSAFREACGEKPFSLFGCTHRLADYAAKNIRFTGAGSRFLYTEAGGVAEVRLQAPGLFSVSNALAAAGAARELGLPFPDVAQALSALPQPPGRAESILLYNRRIVIDYAHTPQALQAILSALRQESAGRLIAVFGCGGDRDRGKRPLMGAAAAEAADAVILTNDNPRSEPPEAILSDILKGIKEKKTVSVIPDRAQAIDAALRLSAPGDCILIAGKGDERQQIVGERRFSFSDRETAERLAEKRFALQKNDNSKR